MGFTIQDYDLRKTFTVDRKLLLYFGFYPCQNAENRFLFFSGGLFTVFFCLGQILTMTVQMVIERNDLSKLSEALQYFITVASFVGKLTNFFIYRRSLLDLEENLTEETFYGFSDDRFQLLKQKIDSCRSVGAVFRFSCVLACSLYALTPYFDKGKSKTLPYPAWFPYNVTSHYYPTYTLQVIGFVNTASTNSAIDILTWTLISIASGQFDILKDNLKNIDWSHKNLKETEEKFGRCVKHHKETVKFVYKIEKMFSKGIFLQFMASIIIICFTGFSMIIVPVQSMQFCFLFFYFCGMMCQVGMYCWYGHDVMTTSNAITEFFYMSNWYESDMTIRKNVIIFLERVKKPVRLTAGGFVTLSLTTLTSILRSAYSYIAVLRRIYDKS